MNFSSDIKFSNDLIKNGETYIIYSGSLYKQNSETVHIVYGFGNNWEHTIEKEMEKNSNGFVAKIKLLDYDKFNFCFKNQYNEWDNNNSSNYTAQIVENDNYENNFIINEGLLDNLIDGIFNTEAVTVTMSNNLNASTIKNNVESLDIGINDSEITNDLNETSTKNINNTNGSNNLDIVSSENTTNASINFDNQEDLINDKEIVNPTTNIDTNINNVESSNNESYVENDVSSNDNFNMDALINEILSPIVTSENLVEENIEPYSKESNTNILEIFDESIDNEYNENDKHVDDVITSYLNDLYNNINTSENTNPSTISDTEDVSNSNNTVNSDYSELDRTISKFKQIQALQDLDSFFETPIVNKSTTSENPIQTEEVKEQEITHINTSESINVFEDLKDEPQIFDEFEEKSLIEESLNNNEIEKNNNLTIHANQRNNEETSLIISPRHISPLYIAKKKIKISFLKIFKFIPRLLNKKFNEE